MAMANTAQTRSSDDPVIQLVTFHLAGETYGINVMQVQEVLRYSTIAPVPGGSFHVLGIINLRGIVVTIIDTRMLFGLPRGDINDNTRIVVIETNGHVIGMLVDSVAEVVYLRQSEIETSPSLGNEESARYIQGVYHKEGELMIILELDKLLTEDEWSELDSF